MSLFQRRHYEWLARFAADEHLSQGEVLALATALARDNPKFKQALFMRAVFERSNHTMPRDELHYTRGIGAGVTHVRVKP